MRVKILILLSLALTVTTLSFSQCTVSYKGDSKDIERLIFKHVNEVFPKGIEGDKYFVIQMKLKNNNVSEARIIGISDIEVSGLLASFIKNTKNRWTSKCNTVNVYVPIFLIKNTEQIEKAIKISPKFFVSSEGKHQIADVIYPTISIQFFPTVK